MHPFLTIATRAARKAGSHMVRALERLEDLKISAKGENDYVSEVDTACENMIIDTLAKSYPSHGFWGEETGETRGEGEFRWIIDPLDGTTNFIHGYPNFCISMACEYRGQIEHALIYDPLRDDLYTASRGSGAFCNNRRVRVRTVKNLSNALISMSFVRQELTEDRLKKILSVTQLASGIRRSGSAALDLAHIASGKLDGCIQWHMQPWDIAAGTLMILEAGGAVIGIEGENWMQTGSFIAGSLKLMPALEAIALAK